MELLSSTDWEVLNATADDWENLERIHGMLQRNTPRLSLTEVADAIHDLVAKGLLAARGEDGTPLNVPPDLSYVWRAWFAMTPEGRELWNAAPQPPAGKPRRTTPRGLWSRLGVPPVTAEEIAEARRELWGRSDRESPR